MTTREKMFAAALLFGAWGGLVVMGMAPVSDFVIGLRDALIALGVFQAALTNPKE